MRTLKDSMTIGLTRATVRLWLASTRLVVIAMLIVGVAACGGGDDGTALQAVSPELSITGASRSEGDSGQSVVEFAVTLSAPSTVPVTVEFETSDGTATAGSDFLPTTGTLTFSPGETTLTIPVPILGDTNDEQDELFTIALSSPVNAIVRIARAQGLIIDNDAPQAALPELSITGVSRSEGDSGQSVVEFAVTLSAPSTVPVTVEFETSDGTATAGSDFLPTTGTLTFSPGETTLTIPVPTLGDTNDEQDEFFTVTLSSPVNATIHSAHAQGLIVDNDPPARTYGLDTRPSNPDCIAPARPTGDASIALVDAFPSAPNFPAPTKLLQAPRDSSRWFVLELGGVVRVFPVANPASTAVFLDLSAEVYSPAGSEGGLLGMAFHPDFPNTPEVFVSYTRRAGNPALPMISVVSRLILDDTNAPSNPIEQTLLTVDQPNLNHKGGDIAFGPDGYLYLGLGDGGSALAAQDTTRLLGKMLRIDVLNIPWPDPGYRIPTSNPFSSNSRCGAATNAQSCPEIYAWGFRNPWRWSFDKQTGDLWAGDVGEGAWEEIDVVKAGGNYGWACREGAHDSGRIGCSAGVFIDPVAEYAHNGGASITGGYVYRGEAIPELKGRYIFADWVLGTFWALRGDEQGGFVMDELARTPLSVPAFAQGSDGELYVTSFGYDRVWKIVPAGPVVPDTIAQDLTATGCVNTADPTLPAAGLVPYNVNAPLWSDGSVKSRFIGLPDGGNIDINATGDWELPPGTVIMKVFRLGGKLIETRLLMRHPDGVWAGYTYAWNETQTAATRIRGGETRVINGQSWVYPSEVQCMQCHTSVAGRTLGLETGQLNGLFTYPSTGRTDNQLATLDHIGMLSTPLPDLPENLPIIPDPLNMALPLTDRARAYLHTNCAQCHRPGGLTPAAIDLRFGTTLSLTSTCNVAPQLGDLGINNAMIIAPGDSQHSVLVARLGRRDAHGMPPLASNIVDVDGLALVTAWVDSLSECN